MATKFLNNLDMTKNQILNLVLQQLASAPGSPVGGQIYYDTTLNKVGYYNGTSWLYWAIGTIVGVTAGAGLSGGGTSGTVTLDVNTDGITLEISSDNVRVKDAGISTAKIADSNVTTIKLANDNVTFAKIQNIATLRVIGRVTAGTGDPEEVVILDEDDFATNSATALATQQSIKAYVDNRIASLGHLIGAFHGSDTDFPIASGGTNAGDYWYVTIAGTVHGVVLNVGDMLIATVDAPTVTTATDWLVIESNRDQATETIQGVAEIATQVETDAGTDDSRIVTPLKLANYIAGLGLAGAGGYSTLIGDGSSTTIVVTHSLGTTRVVILIFDVSTGAQVFTDTVITSTSQVTLNFAAAPTSNQYRINIISA